MDTNAAIGVGTAFVVVTVFGVACACLPEWQEPLGRCLRGFRHGPEPVEVPGARRLAPEELEAIGARSGFSQAELLRLYRRFVRAGNGQAEVKADELMAGLDVLSGPLVPRLPAALRLPPPPKPVDFTTAATALGVFCERTPDDDKTRFLFRLYDADCDGKISKQDLRSTLELILPELLECDDGEELLERAVEGTFEELVGNRGRLAKDDAESYLTLEQFAMVAADLAGERCTGFF